MKDIKAIGLLLLMSLAGMAAKIYHTGQPPTFTLEAPQAIATISVIILMFAVFKRQEQTKRAKSTQ